MRNYLLVLFLTLITLRTYAEECSCPATEEPPQDKTEYTVEYEDVPKYKPGEPVIYQEYRLNRAYLDNSQERLENFFVGWADRSKPISDKHLAQLPTAFQHAYRIFEDFYQPSNLGRIGDPEWGTEQFAKVSYYITQPKIDILVIERLKKDIHAMDTRGEIYRATLQDFRPRIQGKVPALFMSPFYKQILEGFLGNEELPVGHSGIMSTSRAKGESEKRQKFLNQYVQIYHGHWGGWLLRTDPTISLMNFNKDFTKAIVHFSLVYQGGEAFYVYKKGKWVLKKSELTWIT